MHSHSLADEARDWIADSFSDAPANLSDVEAFDCVRRQYCGGLVGLIRDAGSAVDWLTGPAALRVLREADLAECAGTRSIRDALLLRVDLAFWNGRRLDDLDDEAFDRLDVGLTVDEACTVCGVAVHALAEAHWRGWVDNDGDALSYVPTLHDHRVAGAGEPARDGSGWAR